MSASADFPNIALDGGTLNSQLAVPTLDSLTFDVAAVDFDRDAAMHTFDEQGAIVLRGVFPPDDIEFFAQETERYL